MKPNIAALLLLAAAVALSSCGDQPDAPAPAPVPAAAPEGELVIPGCDSARIVVLPTGERVLWMCRTEWRLGGNGVWGGGPAMSAVLLPPLPASKVEK